MGLFEDLEFRGIVKQVTDPGLKTALQKPPVTLYCGFDPTSDSLHVGSLLPLLTLKRFQQAGHRPIAVVGGATGMIGDPSGKSQERLLLTEEILAKNLKGISGVISKFLDLSGPNAAKIVNNADFFKGMDYIQFLRDIGKHFTVNYMMAKESVRARLEDREHGISYTEFSYMLLQAYDYYRLNKEHGCALQIGGSDQWGNITAGIELIRRIRAAGGTAPPEDAPADSFGMTHPLVSKADGTKFGKSEKGNIWLDPKRTSADEFYQFFFNTSDADVMTYLKFFTFRTQAELTDLEAQLKASPEKRVAQKALAEEMKNLVHGDDDSGKRGEKRFAIMHALLTMVDHANGPLEADILYAFGTDELKTKASKDERAALAVVDLLVKAGLSASKSAARNDIRDGGISINGKKVTDIAAMAKDFPLLHGRHLLLRKGKKSSHLVTFD